MSARLRPPKALGARRWSTRVTHEVVLPIKGRAVTGSSFNQPIQVLRNLQRWACFDSLAFGALDAPLDIPCGSVRLGTHVANESHVMHFLDHTERRA